MVTGYQVSGNWYHLPLTGNSIGNMTPLIMAAILILWMRLLAESKRVMAAVLMWLSYIVFPSKGFFSIFIDKNMKLSKTKRKTQKCRIDRENIKM
jgi:glucan phosphoethanolaminetransferase (alkaline phosphatase superfamily)